MKGKLKHVLITAVLLFSCKPSIYLHSNINSMGGLDMDGGIYISNFENYSIVEKDFRAKFNLELQNREYLIVDNLLKSKYYLIINFIEYFSYKNNPSKSKKNIKIMIALTDSKYFKISLKDILKNGHSIWDCKVDLSYIEYLEHQDIIIKTIVNKFLTMSSGKTLLI